MYDELKKRIDGMAAIPPAMDAVLAQILNRVDAISENRDDVNKVRHGLMDLAAYALRAYDGLQPVLGRSTTSPDQLNPGDAVSAPFENPPAQVAAAMSRFRAQRDYAPWMDYWVHVELTEAPVSAGIPVLYYLYQPDNVCFLVTSCPAGAAKAFKVSTYEANSLYARNALERFSDTDNEITSADQLKLGDHINIVGHDSTRNGTYMVIGFNGRFVNITRISAREPTEAFSFDHIATIKSWVKKVFKV